MKKFLIIFLFLCNIANAGGVNYDYTENLEYNGECDVCLKRFDKYKVKGYELCPECNEEYMTKGKVGLHPSRYCGVFCAHSEPSPYEKCSLKDSPHYLKKDDFLKENIIILKKDDVSKMERTVPDKDGGKCWHGVFYRPGEFFNSIWLTDNEYGCLLYKGFVYTKYRGEKIKIEIDNHEEMML